MNIVKKIKSKRQIARQIRLIEAYANAAIKTQTPA